MNNRVFLFICFWPGLMFLAYVRFFLADWLWDMSWKWLVFFYLVMAPLIYFAYRTGMPGKSKPTGEPKQEAKEGSK